MSNITTFHRNPRYSAVAKPPVIKNINRQNGSARSPSTSRILVHNNNTTSNNTFGTTSNRPPPNGSPVKSMHNQLPLSLHRKTGSCQNLSGGLNPQSSNHMNTSKTNDEFHSINNEKYKPPVTSHMGNGNVRPTTNNSFGIQSTNSTPINGNKYRSTITHNVTNGNGRSATNNSFGVHENNSLTQSNKSSFYNGYYESQQPSRSRIATRQQEKSTSSGSSSTNSPEANGNTVSNSFSGSGGGYNTSGTSSGATTSTTTQSLSNATSSDSGNKYNGDSHPSTVRNRMSTFESAHGMPRSETMKSLNNSLNEPRGLVGLANLGNTCFMNSVLQCLSNCKPLHDYCLSNKYDDDLNGNSKSHGTLIKSYSDLMKSMWRSDTEGYVSPDKFRRQFQKIAPSFHGTSQQDSQEFLRIMLEGLHQDVNRVTQRSKPLKINEEVDEELSERVLAEVYWTRYIRIDNSFIVDLFVGQLKSTLLCKKCGHKSVTFDPFWDLSLPIPKNRRDPISLTDCLDLFTSEEMLDGDEMPKCSKCKQKRPCTKRFSIKKFPPLLVIHLKRFSGDRFRSKISAFIEFPTKNLNLLQYDADSGSHKGSTYNLYGVSNHSGTVYGGHYTAYCRNPYSNNWYMYNDTKVQKVNESSVCSSEAYVLFYEMI